MQLIITITKKEVRVYDDETAIETEITFREGSKYLHSIDWDFDASIPKCLNEIGSFIEDDPKIYNHELHIKTEFEYLD